MQFIYNLICRLRGHKWELVSTEWFGTVGNYKCKKCRATRQWPITPVGWNCRCIIKPMKSD